MAGIFSLLVDHRLNSGLPPLGFLGPRLWKVSEAYPGEAFQSVDSGNTKTSCSTGFPARLGECKAHVNHFELSRSGSTRSWRLHRRSLRPGRQAAGSEEIAKANWKSLQHCGSQERNSFTKVSNMIVETPAESR